MNALISTKQKEYIYSFSFSTDRELEPEAQAVLNSVLADTVMKKMTESEFWQLRNQLAESGVEMLGATRLSCDPEPV